MPKIENTGTQKLNIITYASKKFSNIGFIQSFSYQGNKKGSLQNPRNVRRSIMAAAVIRAILLHEHQHAHEMIKKTKYLIRCNKPYPSTYTESKRSRMSSELSTVLSARTLAEELILIPI